MSIMINGRLIRSQMIGVSRYTHEIVERLHDQVEILMPPRNSGQLRGLLWEQIELPRHLHSGDLLWSPANTGPIAVKNQVITIHDVIYLEHPEWFRSAHRYWYRFLQPRLARRSCKIITISQYSRQRILDIFKLHESKVIVIPEGVNESFTPASLMEITRMKIEHNISTPFLLTLGTIETRKNLDRLFLAWQSIHHNYPDFELVVAGVTRQYQKVGNANPLPKGIRFLGYVDDNDLPALYTAAEAFIYPSLYEGFGLPPLEAMACGTPVIVSNTTSLPEVVGDAGLMINPHNESEIADAVERVIIDSELRATLRQKGLERARQFSWDSTASRVWEVLMEVMEENKRDARII